MKLAPIVLLLGACATPGPTRSPAPAQPPAPLLTGTWTWTHRAIHPITGDLHLQEEIWYLNHSGDEVRGHYERAVTAISGDGRPFRCNEELSFTKRTRYQVRGTLRQRRLQMEETEYAVDTDACDDGVRELDRYLGEVRDDSIVLSWGSGQQILRRAVEAPSPTPALDIAGEWAWEHRTVGADGDRRIEQERWVLDQRDGEIVGRYESVVTVTSGGGQPFHCNQAGEYTMRAEFEVAGSIEDGRRVVLRETAVHVQPGPCERGQRRLASYRGSFAEGTLVLDWGGGRQTLHRR